MRTRNRISRPALANICRAVCFLVVGAALLLGIQRVLSKKWIYPSSNEDTTYGMSEFYQLTQNTGIEAAFLGSSVTLYGVDPMAIYERNGIATYNLGSSEQPMEVSRFLCAELLKSHDVQAVMLDVGKLVNDVFSELSYRVILDNVPLSRNKLELAWEYATQFPEEKQFGSLLGSFLPIYRYHDRWSDLSSVDFEKTETLNYYRKGYNFTTNVTPNSEGAEWMNNMAELMQRSAAWTRGIVDGRVIEDDNQDDALYGAFVNEAALECLKQIKQMCDENGVELILMKVPSIGAPQSYGGAWTKLRSEAMKKLAKELDLKFLDLLYDVDLGIDWTQDLLDGGPHLNYSGAAKISAFLGDYLKEECGLDGTPCQAYEEDLPVYCAMRRVAQMQMTDNLAVYLDALQQYENISVFCSVSDDMTSHMTEETRAALKRFGFQTDFDSLGYSDSFLAVVEDGVVRSEITSSRCATDDGTLDCGCEYEISSCGWLAGSKSQIEIDGKEYSMNHRGINIVVLDNASGLVLDSVAFDTWDLPENQSAIRNNASTEKFLREYEKSLMIEHAKNIGV